MSLKRTIAQWSDSDNQSDTKRTKSVDAISYLHQTLCDSGLVVKHFPEKCTTSLNTIEITRNIKKNLEKHYDYPRNVSEFYTSFVKECHNLDTFKHYLFSNIIRIPGGETEEHPVTDSVIKILLSIPILQNKMIEYVFERAMDLAAQSSCGPWIQMILKCFSTLDNLLDSKKLFDKLIDLLDIATEKIVRHEIICAIPDIIENQEHHYIAVEMSRLLSEDHELIPAVLDCLSYLSLSEEQYAQLQKKTLNILMNLTKCNYFPLFVKFLLIPNQMTDVSYMEAVQGLRNTLRWPSIRVKPQDISSSQVLTGAAIRNTMVSSKVIANAWLKVITNCKLNTDHKPIDFIILLLLFSTSEEKQNQVESLVRKQIKMGVLRENLLDETFEKFSPILKDYLKNLMELANSLLKTKADPEAESFASYLYTLMLSELEDCCQTILAELWKLILDAKQCVMNVLTILNNVATKDMSLLKPQCIQMLTLLDRTHEMPLTEVHAVMNLLCGLAFSYENSIIRDDIYMIIKKQLSSADTKTKIQGILAGIHAVKYLMANSNSDETKEIPDDVSFGSVTVLAEGDSRDAAQIIEQISCVTKPYPDIVAFFNDELSSIISSASFINKNLLSWLTNAATNDLQQYFVVDTIEKEQIGGLKLCMRYCLNAESEMDEIIAINIAGLALQPKSEICVLILSPLFQLVQTLHSQQLDNNLSSIDALLGCAIVMPNFDVDLVEDMDQDIVRNILDCLVHCVNWFRELLNAFSTQNDDALHSKILKRLIQIEELELLICEILMRSKILYKPPVTTFNIKKYTGEQHEKKTQVQSTKHKQKKNALDDTVLPETTRTQATQNSSAAKNKPDAVHNINFRQMNLNLLHLLKLNMATENESDSELTPKKLRFLLKCVNHYLENILISKIKRKTFLSKQEDVTYNPQKAEETAKAMGKILPKLMEHLQQVTSQIECHINPKTPNQSEILHSDDIAQYIMCLEYVYNMLTIFFRWIGFRNSNKATALLKTSLRTVSNSDIAIIPLNDLLLAVAKKFEEHESYCLQLSTAVSLIELIKVIQSHTDNKIILKILKNMSQTFMSQQWKTLDGLPEKGMLFNQSVDRLASIFFTNNDILSLKNLSLQLTNDINNLKTRNDTLSSMKCINKNNFPILYRNLGTALYESTKSSLNRGMTNSEHLALWKDVAFTLKNMSDIAKTLESRNNLSAFFKKSLPVLKLFMAQGLPILELQFKNDTQEVVEILKMLQKSTRFLQTLCCHSRLKRDTALMSKVPLMRQLLETLLYKVKAVLAANKCSEAFWMGNLKNKDIHGEIIASQQSIASEESLEDCDEQLPDDDDSNDSEEEMLDPDSRSVSDIV